MDEILTSKHHEVKDLIFDDEEIVNVRDGLGGVSMLGVKLDEDEYIEDPEPLVSDEDLKQGYWLTFKSVPKTYRTPQEGFICDSIEYFNNTCKISLTNSMQTSEQPSHRFKSRKKAARRVSRGSAHPQTTSVQLRNGTSELYFI